MTGTGIALYKKGVSCSRQEISRKEGFQNKAGCVRYPNSRLWGLFLTY